VHYDIVDKVNVVRYINPRFTYLLTYLQITEQECRISQTDRASVDAAEFVKQGSTFGEAAPMHGIQGSGFWTNSGPP